MVTTATQLWKACAASVWNRDPIYNNDLKSEEKFSHIPKSAQHIDNTFESVNEVPRKLSSFLKFDSFLNGAGIVLTAVGLRLRSGVTTRWLQNWTISTISINAGLGVLTCATTAKVMSFAQIDYTLFKFKNKFHHEVRYTEANLMQNEEWRKQGDTVIGGSIFTSDVDMLKFIQRFT